jgi:hypothetical protein
MDRSKLQDDLTRAERLVADCSTHVERQRLLVMDLKGRGPNATKPRCLLMLFEIVLAIHTAERDQLVEELNEAAKVA